MNVLQLSGTIDAKRVNVRSSKAGGLILQLEQLNVRISSANSKRLYSELQKRYSGAV